MGSRKIKKKIKQQKEKFEFTPEFQSELLILIKGKRSPEDIAAEFVRKEIIPSEKVDEVVSIITTFRKKRATQGNLLLTCGILLIIIGGYFTLLHNKLLLVVIVGVIVTIAGVIVKRK